MFFNFGFISDWFNKWVDGYYYRPIDYKPERMKYLNRILWGCVIIGAGLSVLSDNLSVKTNGIILVGLLIIILIERLHDRMRKEHLKILYGKWWRAEMPSWRIFFIV